MYVRVYVRITQVLRPPAGIPVHEVKQNTAANEPASVTKIEKTMPKAKATGVELKSEAKPELSIKQQQAHNSQRHQSQSSWSMMDDEIPEEDFSDSQVF